MLASLSNLKIAKISRFFETFLAAPDAAASAGRIQAVARASALGRVVLDARGELHRGRRRGRHFGRRGRCGRRGGCGFGRGGGAGLADGDRGRDASQSALDAVRGRAGPRALRGRARTRGRGCVAVERDPLPAAGGPLGSGARELEPPLLHPFHEFVALLRTPAQRSVEEFGDARPVELPVPPANARSEILARRPGRHHARPERVLEEREMLQAGFGRRCAENASSRREHTQARLPASAETSRVLQQNIRRQETRRNRKDHDAESPDMRGLVERGRGLQEGFRAPGVRPPDSKVRARRPMKTPRHGRARGWTVSAVNHT